MRIISGKRRGLKLADLGKGDASAHLRPTSDRVRESLFNLLLGGKYDNPVSGARVLDLFAGTGALGLEAWSRGADHVTFVDNGKAATALIRDNTLKCGADDQIRHIRRDATRLGEAQSDPFDLIFVDPPYGQGSGATALAEARDGGWLTDGALVVWEDATPQPAPDGFQFLETRRYGGTHITLLRFTHPAT